MNSYDHWRKSLLVLGRGVFKSGSIIDEQKIEEIQFYIMKSQGEVTRMIEALRELEYVMEYADLNYISLK